METAWIPRGDIAADDPIALQLWIGPSACQKYEHALVAQLGPEARIQPASGSTGRGPGVVLLSVDDMRGPHGPMLMELCRRALPGRPVICGGSRDRDALLIAINTWHAFRVLPRRSSPEMVAVAARQAHEALTLELTVEQTIEDLRHRCSELQRSMDQLQDAQQQLVRSERMATVGKVSGALLPLLQVQSRNLDALERSLESLGDPTLDGLLRDVVGRVRSGCEVVEEMLAYSKTPSRTRKRIWTPLWSAPSA